MSDQPDVIGPYRILSVLGRGGMGVVYQAVHAETGERVALKTVTGLRRRYMQSVRREVRALLRLAHPGVVRIVAEGVHDGAPWYGMELVDGVTLRSYRRVLRSPTLARGETAPWVGESFLDVLKRNAQSAIGTGAVDALGLSTAALPPSDDEGATFTHLPGAGGAAALLGLEGATRTHMPRSPVARLLAEADGEVALDEPEGATRTSLPTPGQRAALANVDDEGATFTHLPVPKSERLSATHAEPEDGEGDTRSSPGGLQIHVKTGRGVQVDTGGEQLPRATSPLSQEAFPSALELFQHLCATLAYLHGEGLVHRDLKPDNVLVRHDGRPILLDFGLVTSAGGRVGREVLEDLVSLGAGTASYMAPEQIRGDFVDARADLYALGCMLYEVMVGYTPFRGNRVAAILAQHLRAKHEPLRAQMPWVPAELDELVAQLLVKEPSQRLGHAGDLARALERMSGKALPVAELPPAKPFLFRPGMAGRGEVLDQLLAAVARLEVNEGGIVLLGATSGMGKTRLALELGRRATDQGAVLLTGECDPRGVRPLGPFRTVLQTVADRCSDGGESTTTTLLGQRGKVLVAYEPSLISVPGLDTLPEPEPLPASEARERLFKSLYDTLTVLGQDARIVLLIDDLQWADELTLGFLEYLHARIARGMLPPFLVLATFRSDEAPERLTALARERRVSCFELAPLDEKNTSAVIAEALGTREAPAPFAAFVSRHARGIPFYVTEYVRAAVEGEVLIRREGGFALKGDGAEQALPTSLPDLVTRRVRSLDEALARVAEAASVLGKACSLESLALVCGLEDTALLDAVNELRRRQILEDARDGSVRFFHDKLAEFTYQNLSRDERVRLHEAAAAALEAVHAEALEDLAEALAVHHEEAGNAERAVHYLLVAGDRARSMYANREAERCYERATGMLLKQGDVERAAKTLMKLGLVHTAAFEPVKAKSAYDRAFALFRDAGNQGAHGGGMAPAELRIAAGDPVSLDPARTYDSDSSFFQVQLFDGLVELDVDHNVLPALAAGWDLDDDGKRYTFHLREDAVWSDGTPVTAADFEFAWKRNLLPSTRSPAAQLLYLVENAQEFHQGQISDGDLVGVNALSRSTLEVRLKAPCAYLPYLLSHPVTYPQPWWVIQEQGRRWTHPDYIVTNGPYLLADRSEGGLTLRRNPDYRGRFLGNASDIECRVFSRYPDAVRAYAEDDIEVLDLISSDASVMADVTRRFGNELRFIPLLSTNYVLLRADLPPLDDRRVRAALAAAIDREALEARLSGTEHQIARGGFVPPGLPGHSPDLAPRFDVAHARTLLEQAGYARGEDLPPIRWLHTHGLGDLTFLEVIAASWREHLGVRVEIEQVQWEQFVHAVEHKPPHVMLGGWIADYPDPDSFLRAVFHSGEGSEPTGWVSASFDRLVEAAAQTTEQQARLDLYRKADQLVVDEDVVAIPLSYGRTPMLMKPRILRFPPATSFMRYLKDVIVASGIG